ncbi:glycosyltransferase family 4 protein [Photobacterium phosphoreum]|uniref:glycosyltransferase family 4 protein n=1 Tax=Photobacterium phosphoreum TaxID=659 RepID=UPI0024BBB899|nr:glycosyltransferase family 1 protein [Photobacterium phosphoreum]
MIIYDGIIEKLQSGGGVTVVFNELIARSSNYKYISYDEKSKFAINPVLRKSRLLERYLNVNVDEYSNENTLFHSTYYRLPVQKENPIITTVHDFTYEKFNKGLSSWVHSWQKNKAINNSDKIICVSENTAQDLLKYCPINESKIEIVHNGVSDDYYVLKSDKRYSNEVVFVGARSGYKNFSAVIDVVALCPNLSLSVVGGGVFNKAELSLLNNKLPGRFKWLGRLSNQELNEVYNRSYCLLYPSSYEGFGIPVIEAMRSGCPVVALNISSIPEVAGSAALLIEYLDINLLAEAVKSLDNSSYREKYIQAGLINSQRFSWDRCFMETQKVYRSLS